MKLIGRWLCFYCLVLLPLGAATADDSRFKAAVLQHFFINQQETALTLSGETIHGRNFISRMYLANDYRPIWSESGIKSLSVALDGLAADGLNPADYRLAPIKPVLAAPKLGGLDAARAAELDILLSEAYLRAVYNLYFGKADPQRLDPDINFARALEGEDQAPRLLAAARKGDIEGVFEWARPDNKR